MLDVPSPLPSRKVTVMDCHTRYEEDTTLDIRSIYDPTQQTRVIRSHRKPPTYTISLTRRKVVIALLVSITVLPAAMAHDEIPSGHADTLAVVAPDVELSATLPNFDSPTFLEATPTVTPSLPLLAREEAAQAEKLAQQKTAPKRVEPKAASRKATRKPPRIEIVIRYALAQRGDPYRWGSAGPNSYDCSGLLVRSFRQIGIQLPHFTGALIGKGKRISRSEMSRGDIVFPSPGHVGIYLGDGMMVHASSGKGKVVVAKVYSFYAARRIT